MNVSLQPILEKSLRATFNLSLLWFVLTAAWTSGWHMVGDAYALGPYLPWLELVFPLSGLGLWGAFFAQWALGELRAIHISRWFYLLLFCALLMLSVLFSIQPESSLGYLSVWLTASLALSLQLESLFKTRWFWRAYAAIMGFNMILWWFVPGFIQVEWWLCMLWFPVLWWWQAYPAKSSGLLLAWGTLAAGVFVSVGQSLLWLVWLSFFIMWFAQYSLLRRRNVWLWVGGITSFSVFAVFFLSFSFLGPWLNIDLSASFKGFNSWWLGVGLGQFEWAQFQAQNFFSNPVNYITDVPLWVRWWYEHGLLMVPLLLALWLLTVGHTKTIKFRSFLFWGTIILAPTLWIGAGGILIAAWWFFNRHAWEPSIVSLSDRSPIPKVDPLNRRV